MHSVERTNSSGCNLFQPIYNWQEYLIWKSGWSLCLLLARLCHWAYCFLYFSSSSSSIVHILWTRIVKSFVAQQHENSGRVTQQHSKNKRQKKIQSNWHIKLPRLIKKNVCVFEKQCANNEGKFKVYYRKTACLFLSFRFWCYAFLPTLFLCVCTFFSLFSLCCCLLV